VLPDFTHYKHPFDHWMADGFVSKALVAQMNDSWPTEDFPGWRVEGGKVSRKASLLFPNRLPEPAQALSEKMFSPHMLSFLSSLVGLELHPDPWFKEGPEEPRLGGGLHEIRQGGLLGVHVDFDAHPSGLTRVANLLIYLNESWKDTWGGHLELHAYFKDLELVKNITPIGGRAVLFRTTGATWHGHPHPLRTPDGVARRSLALYYYAKLDTSPERPTTIYRRIHSV